MIKDALPNVILTAVLQQRRALVGVEADRRQIDEQSGRAPVHQLHNGGERMHEERSADNNKQRTLRQILCEKREALVMC